MACGPAVFVAAVSSGIVGLVVICAICAVALAHRERMRAVARDPFLDPEFEFVRPRPDLGLDVVEVIPLHEFDRIRRAVQK